MKHFHITNRLAQLEKELLAEFTLLQEMKVIQKEKAQAFMDFRGNIQDETLMRALLVEYTHSVKRQEIHVNDLRKEFNRLQNPTSLPTFKS